MDHLFDFKNSFMTMKTSYLFSTSDQELHGRIFERLSIIDQSEFSNSSVLLTRICFEEIPKVIDSGGVLALSRADRVVLQWRSIWTMISSGTDQFDEESEKMSFHNYLLYNASISPADIREINQAQPIAPPLDFLPDYKSPIEVVDHQRYNIQLGFMVNRVNQELIDSKDGRSADALNALNKIFPNVYSGDRFVRQIPVPFYKTAQAFSVKTKFLFGLAQGSGACVQVLNGLLLDRDLKAKTGEMLRAYSANGIQDDVIDLLYELLVKSDIRSLLKHVIKDSGLSVIDTPALPLRTALTVIKKINK